MEIFFLSLGTVILISVFLYTSFNSYIYATKSKTIKGKIVGYDKKVSNNSGSSNSSTTFAKVFEFELNGLKYRFVSSVPSGTVSYDKIGTYEDIMILNDDYRSARHKTILHHLLSFIFFVSSVSLNYILSEKHDINIILLFLVFIVSSIITYLIYKNINEKLKKNRTEWKMNKDGVRGYNMNSYSFINSKKVIDKINKFNSIFKIIFLISVVFLIFHHFFNTKTKQRFTKEAQIENKKLIKLYEQNKQIREQMKNLK